MRALFDVNMLIALIDSKHVEHRTANAWLATNLASGWASCPLTENGCLRVLTGTRYPNRRRFDETFTLLEAVRNRPGHEFWPDSLSITDSAVFNRGFLRGHQQVTDTYLLALAVAHHGRLVTFDRNIRRNTVIGCGSEHLVVL